MSGYTKSSFFSKLLRISADKRLPGQGGDRATNFVIDLGSNLQRCKRLSIQSVNFPNNFYNVFSNTFNGQHNNIGYFTYNSVPGSFTITPGFYNAAQLMSAITTAYNAAIAQSQITSFTQDPISQLVTLSFNSDSKTTTVRFDTDNSGTTRATPFTLLGFTGSASATNSTTTTTATSLPSLSGLTEAYIVSSALAPSNSFDEKGQLSNVLVGIPITSAFGQLNVFDCHVDVLCEVLYPRSRDLVRCDFMLVDRNGYEVNLNGGQRQARSPCVVRPLLTALIISKHGNTQEDSCL